jgi:hypothetical protein
MSVLSAHLAPLIPKDTLKPLKKEAREHIKFAQALAADTKEGIVKQSRIQKLSNIVFAACPPASLGAQPPSPSTASP